MRLFKFIGQWFDFERQRAELKRESAILFARLGEKDAAIKALSEANERLIAQKDILAKELEHKQEDVARLEALILFTPATVNELNRKIDELNRDLRAVADAEKIVEAARAMTRLFAGEKI